MESKRHQKLLEHYKAVLGEEPAFSLKLKKNVLPNDMKPITTLVFKPTDEIAFLEAMHHWRKRLSDA